MNCKTDKDEKTKPTNETKLSPIKEKVLPQWKINLREAKDVGE